MQGVPSSFAHSQEGFRKLWKNVTRLNHVLDEGWKLDQSRYKLWRLHVMDLVLGCRKLSKNDVSLHNVNNGLLFNVVSSET